MKTLRESLVEFIEHEKIGNRSRAYQRALHYSVGRLLAWLETTHSVFHPEKLTAQHMAAWGRYVTARTTGKGLPLKPTSICKQFICDRAFIRWLGRRGIVPTALAEELPYPKLPDRLPTSVLTHRQMMKLLYSVNSTTPEGHQLRAMLELFYSSGVRVAELLGLDIEAVDFKNRQALVRGKGEKERMVPIGETAARFIETYLKAFRPLLVRDPQDRALWLDRQGSRMPYHTFRRQLLEVAVASGLPVHVTAHTFRRSFTTELIRNGANLWHVKEALGHESIETLTPYTKLTIPDLKKTHAKCHPREKDHR